MFFTGKDDSPSIEEYIQYQTSSWKYCWRICLHYGFQEDARIWWNSFNYNELMTLSDEAYVKLILDYWFYTKCKDEESSKGLLSCENSILKVHGCIHKKKVIVSINPSCMHNFINVQWVNRLQVPAKDIQSAHVEDENVNF